MRECSCCFTYHALYYCFACVLSPGSLTYDSATARDAAALAWLMTQGKLQPSTKFDSAACRNPSATALGRLRGHYCLAACPPHVLRCMGMATFRCWRLAAFHVSVLVFVAAVVLVGVHVLLAVPTTLSVYSERRVGGMHTIPPAPRTGCQQTVVSEYTHTSLSAGQQSSLVEAFRLLAKRQHNGISVGSVLLVNEERVAGMARCARLDGFYGGAAESIDSCSGRIRPGRSKLARSCARDLSCLYGLLRG